MNKINGSIVGCDLELKNGDTCGVQAIGRCATCERAFCVTHQAHKEYTYGWVPYAGLCVSCFAKTPEEVARAKEAKERAELRDAQEYFMSGAARTALLTVRVPPVKIYSVERRSKPSFFGYKEVEDVTPFIHQYGGTRTEVQQIWILGEFMWQYRFLKYPPDSYETVTGKCLTALLDLSPAFPGDWVYYPLVRVRPWSRGYEYLQSCAVGFFGWMEAAQAVKRLTGESS